MAFIKNHKISEQKEIAVLEKWALPNSKLDKELESVVCRLSATSRSLVQYSYGNQLNIELVHNQQLEVNLSNQGNQSIDIHPANFDLIATADSAEFNKNFDSLDSYENYISGLTMGIRAGFKNNEIARFYNCLRGKSAKNESYYSQFNISVPSADLLISSKKSVINSFAKIQTHIETISADNNLDAKNIILLMSPMLFNKVKPLFNRQTDITESTGGNMFYYNNLIIKKDIFLKNMEFIACPAAQIIYYQPFYSKVNFSGDNELLLIKKELSNFDRDLKILFKHQFEYINILPDSCISGSATESQNSDQSIVIGG